MNCPTDHLNTRVLRNSNGLSWATFYSSMRLYCQSAVPRYYIFFGSFVSYRFDYAWSNLSIHTLHPFNQFLVPLSFTTSTHHTPHNRQFTSSLHWGKLSQAQVSPEAFFLISQNIFHDQCILCTEQSIFWAEHIACCHRCSATVICRIDTVSNGEYSMMARCGRVAVIASGLLGSLALIALIEVSATHLIIGFPKYQITCDNLFKKKTWIFYSVIQIFSFELSTESGITSTQPLTMARRAMSSLSDAKMYVHSTIIMQHVHTIQSAQSSFSKCSSYRRSERRNEGTSWRTRTASTNKGEAAQ